MEFSRLQLALQTAILAIVFAAAGRAEEKDTPPFSARDLQAKIAYCQLCHQPLGQGFRAAFLIPRLAGQQTEYFENQLRAFTERRRLHPIMVNVAHSLNRILNPSEALQRNSWPPGKNSTKREFPMPIFRPALPVTVRRLKARGKFHVWRVSSMTTS